MCGIFGYIGNKNASEAILEGLKRLEYRGYDSWGIAVVADEIKLAKKVGAIGDLDTTTSLPFSKTGIGHTRWATHGGISDLNAHPHFSTDKSFCLAQNGIVENYQDLKRDLKKKGYRFITETDTEVIVRLIEEQLKTKKDLKEAVRAAFLQLKGRNTIILMTKDGQIIAARNGSPLVIGINDKEIFFSSDTLSFAPFASKAIIVENGQLVTYDSEIKLTDISSDRKLPLKIEKIDFESSKVDKEGYDHFMIKEIHETPYVINQVLNQDESKFEELVSAIKNAKNVYTLGVGTAGGAASQIAFYLRAYSKINAIALNAADAIDQYELLQKDDLMIVPSQSGESADVLEVMEQAKKKGVKIASYVNMPGSTMSRLSDFKFMTNAGPEICVMSTKVYTSQIAFGYLISKMVAGKSEEGRKNLRDLAKEAEDYLNTESNHKLIKKLSKDLAKKEHIFLLSKFQNFNIVREGMIKLIEGSYVHAHAIPSSDLKHYAITLMETGVPVLVVLSEDEAKSDILNAVNEVKARGATVIGISPKKYEKFDFHLQVADMGEVSAILNVIPLQLLSYYMAVELGHNVDKPRNIAKSVTVK